VKSAILVHPGFDCVWPPGDPLLGRHNVVHTPHNAGRTAHANRRFAEMLAEQFRPAGN
jgi:phosphoglycerate dehydrogenase-like enzyme